MHESLNWANSYENTKPAGKSAVDYLQHLPKASVREKNEKNSDQLMCNMQPLVVLKKLVNF